jgi:hypothetical protein
MIMLTIRAVPPVGCRGVRTPPLLENFQFFPAKIADFIAKKDHQIEKIGIAPPTFKKLYIHLLSSQKFPLHPLTFFFAAHPCSQLVPRNSVKLYS